MSIEMIDKPKSRRTRQVAERFWNFVKKAGPDECWAWTGSTDRHGYGAMSVEGKRCRAHRVSYKIHNSESIDELLVRHRCHNRICVNPAHLISGTHLDNTRDCIDAGRRRPGRAQKYSDELVGQVRIAVGTDKEVAKRLGVSTSRVNEIRNGARVKPEDCLPVSLGSFEFMAVEAENPNSCRGCLLEQSTLRQCKNSIRLARERGIPNCDDTTSTGNTYIFVTQTPEGGAASSVEQDAAPITNKTN